MFGADCPKLLVPVLDGKSEPNNGVCVAGAYGSNGGKITEGLAGSADEELGGAMGAGVVFCATKIGEYCTEFAVKRGEFPDEAIEPYVMAAGVCATLDSERKTPQTIRAIPIVKKRAVITGTLAIFRGKNKGDFYRCC